jgi:hypothetical protein
MLPPAAFLKLKSHNGIGRVIATAKTETGLIRHFLYLYMYFHLYLYNRKASLIITDIV